MARTKATISAAKRAEKEAAEEKEVWEEEEGEKEVEEAGQKLDTGSQSDDSESESDNKEHSVVLQRAVKDDKHVVEETEEFPYEELEKIMKKPHKREERDEPFWLDSNKRSVLHAYEDMQKTKRTRLEAGDAVARDSVTLASERLVSRTVADQHSAAHRQAKEFQETQDSRHPHRSQPYKYFKH
eukprot:Platyproteum_vivax@DN1463_c0_g1_i1.p1